MLPAFSSSKTFYELLQISFLFTFQYSFPYGTCKTTKEYVQRETDYSNNCYVGMLADH
jgi:hypothetical protein